MLYGLMLVALITGWTVLAVHVGRRARRATGKRWKGWTAFGLVMWLPLWDVPLGLVLYTIAVFREGGVHIYRTAEAEGYLRRRACSNCSISVASSPYRYLEFEMGPNGDLYLRSLTSTPGYYQFSLGERGTPECAPFDALPNADRIRETTLIADDECIVVVRHDEPVSRFEHDQGLEGWSAYHEWWPFLQRIQRVVYDRTEGEVIAEASQFRYRSWLSTVIGIVGWDYTRENGSPIRFAMRDVVAPLNQRTEEAR